MRTAAEFDPGPLTWVKGEIDQALQQAEDALARFETDEDATRLRFCRTHVHQVQGALAIVGLEGVARVCESLESLLAGMADGTPPPDGAATAAVHQALRALRDYLDALMAGEPDQPLRLWPIHAALAERRGLSAVSPDELFFPDLSQRPPRRPAPPPLSDEAMSQLLRSERRNFQQGLLAWLKTPATAAAGRRQMCAALAAIEAAQPTPAARLFWWISLAFLESIDETTEHPAGDGQRQLCAKIDAQFRRLLAGGGAAPDRLLCELLYPVALAPADRHPLIAEVQDTFALPALLPAADRSAIASPHDATLRRLREAAQAMEETWQRLCHGHPDQLANFVALVHDSSRDIAGLGHTDLKRLGQSLDAATHWLAEAPARQGEPLAMEIATAILLLQDALEHFRGLGTDFARQVDRMVDRLHSCMAGRTPASDDAPLLDDMSRRAQEKRLIGQVAREIQGCLGQIEQALDVFFRDPAATLDAEAVDDWLQQAAGALAMLGHLDAAAALKACGKQIRGFAAPGLIRRETDFETLAQTLALIGFFVDALPAGERNFTAFAARLRHDAAAEAGAETADGTAASAENAPPGTDDSRDAGPVEADAGAPAEPAPGAAPLPESTENSAPDSATDNDIDAELLAIFIEEAHGVLATMATQRTALAANPHDATALTTLRRATHTLKGSGRMVGLTELGETAWELEQTFNLWLSQDWPASTALQEMVAAEHTLFSAWVAHLEGQAPPPPAPAPLIALARTLRGCDDSAAETAPAAIQSVELPAPAVDNPAPAEILTLPPEPVPPELPPAEPLPSAPPPAETALGGDPHLEATAAALADLLLDEAPTLMPEPTPESPPEAAPEPAAPESADMAPVPPEPAAAVDTTPAAAPPPTLYDIFREEARGHLQTLIDQHDRLVADPLQATPFPMVRAAHTLGSIAGTVGLLPLRTLGQALEQALLRRDASGQPESPDGLETVRQAIMTLEQMYDGLAGPAPLEAPPPLLAALGAAYPPPAAGKARPEEEAAPALPQLADELDPQLLPIFLEEAAEQLRQLDEQLQAWRQAPDDREAPRAIARILHTFKGNARMAGAMNLGELTHLLETRVGELLAADTLTPAVIDEIEAGCDALAAAAGALAATPLDSATPGEAGQTPPTADGNEAQAVLRVRAEVVDRLVNEAGELAIARARIEGEMRGLKTSLLDLTESVARLRRQLRDIEIQAETRIAAGAAADAPPAPGDGSDFDPLELDRFTRFQELTRFMAESVNDVATIQQNLLQNLDAANAALLAQSGLNRNLQQALMNVRMLPFASQAERLYRTVRQAAREVGKRVRLDIVGGQVNLDRSLLDRIVAPLEHMLRNAVVHGIEDKAERLAAGKPETGELTLRLNQEGNEVILTLTDDGGGLNLEKIRARAEALGLLDPSHTVNAATLHDFILRPGFSTADSLSPLAGRGVGMDVARSEIAALGGRIEIQSLPGQGTTFRLYLPLTLAMMPVLLVRVGAQCHAIPASMIEQAQELKAEEVDALRQRGSVEWQGKSYPYHFLAHLLGAPEAMPEPHRRQWVLLLRSGGQRVAVQVDGLRGNEDVVVKHTGEQLARVAGISGATVLGDGQVVLILNPVALAARPAAASAAPPTEPAPADTPALPPVMVVDDSLTVRKITSRLLGRAGYPVLLAKDGVDALEQLVEARPAVILSDIEMPRMDGFDLVRNIRADARLKAVPIIMITSRTADKHRQHALDIGANAYLGKPYDEDELLRLIAGYVQSA